MECSHCGAKKQQGNFCSNCGKKMAMECKYCWLKKQSYSCKFERCPDYGVIIFDKLALTDIEQLPETKKINWMYVYAMMANIGMLIIVLRHLLESLL